VQEANQQRAEEGLDPLTLPPDLDPELPHFSTNAFSGNQILPRDDTEYVMDDAPDDGECFTGTVHGDGECVTNDDIPDGGECVIGKLSDDGETVLSNVPDDSESVIVKLSDEGGTVLCNVPNDGECVIGKLTDDGETVRCNVPDDGESVLCNVPDDGEGVIGDEKLLVADYEDGDSVIVQSSSTREQGGAMKEIFLQQRLGNMIST
jgi:hypothetical protein